MKLVLFRHGLAVDRQKFLEHKKDDALRPLVAKGKIKTLEMAKRLETWVPDFDMIVASPFVRSLETAHILAKVLKVSNLFESAELVPSAPVMAFVQWLHVHAEECRSVLVVGHEPHLSSLAGWCLTGQKESFIELKKSGIIALEIENFSELRPGTGQLLWHVSPKQFGI